MDFCCQRCGKGLEIDESLLRVDLPMGDLARGGKWGNTRHNNEFHIFVDFLNVENYLVMYFVHLNSSR